MVKPKVENETRERRFKRLGTARTLRILNNLRLLGNCSNRNIYSYSQEDVEKTFSAISRELRRVKAMFDETRTEFSLE